MIKTNLYLTVNSLLPVRIDSYLADNITHYTRSHIKLMIESGLISLNGNIINKAGIKVKSGDEITICVHEPEKTFATAENIPLDIIYEDNDLALINKPQGMVTHPAPGNYGGTLVNAALYHMEGLSGIGGALRPGIVHRLDKDTSGLIIIAKNDEAHVSLSKQISNHEIIKEYIALLYGNLKDDKGIIKSNIGRHPTNRKQMAVLPTGREAITHYEVIKRYGKYTLVKFRIETGRTHQIRVHAKHIGHPIVGDTTYCHLKNSFGLNGQLLHASHLIFKHPKNNNIMDFSIPLPKYFEQTLLQLENNK